MKKKKVARGIPLTSLLGHEGFDRSFKLATTDGATDPKLVEALQDMVLHAAHTGRKFSEGRKPGTTGPIRKAIAKMIKANPRVTNADLWDKLKEAPPRGWQFFETDRLGKYIEGPHSQDHMGFHRFINIAAEERKKLKE